MSTSLSDVQVLAGGPDPRAERRNRARRHLPVRMAVPTFRQPQPDGLCQSPISLRQLAKQFLHPRANNLADVYTRVIISERLEAILNGPKPTFAGGQRDVPKNPIGCRGNVGEASLRVLQQGVVIALLKPAAHPQDQACRHGQA